MASISAADIKRVREITGAGMTDVKAALVENDGDQEKAIDALRKKGAAKAVKRGAERTASNGIVATAGQALIELACETDFVAKNEQFQKLANDIVTLADTSGAADAEALLAQTMASGSTVQEEINVASGALQEKFELRRYARFEGSVATYMHRRASDLPPQIGVLVEFTGSGDEAAEAARGAAMQVASLGAQYVTRDEVPADAVERERAVAEATAKEEGKPEQALPKIVEGRVNGFYKDVVLLEQPSVRDSKKTVKAVLAEAGVEVTRFARFEVGKA